jgi:Ca-activated chloride channel family protein
MYRLEYPAALYLLIFAMIIAFAYFLYLRWQQKKLRILGDIEIVNALLIGKSKLKNILKFLMSIIAFILIIFSIANLQVAGKLDSKATSATVDVIFAIDISRSMLAEDIRPNRIERAKMLAMSIVDEVKYAKFGIVLFAGDAFIHLPITSDSRATRMFLQSVSTDLISLQGTAIGKAIDVSLQAFNRTQAKNKSIILISDGENFEDTPLPFARQAAQNNIIIHSVIVGSEKGAPIPIKNNQGQVIGFRKDREGNTVITKPDYILLSQNAQATGGVTVNAEQMRNATEQIEKELAKLEREASETIEFTDYHTLFPIFAIPALLLLVFDFLLYERRMKWQNIFQSLLRFSIKPNKIKEQ